MPEITVGQAAALMELGLTDVYKETLEATPETWKTWLRSKTAERMTDHDRSTSGIGPVTEKPPGSPFQTDRIYIGAQKTYTLVPYGIAIVLQHEVIKYEWYGVYEGVAQSLAKAARNKYEVIAYSILNRAFDTTDPVYTDFEGEALCAVTHTRLDGGTWQNRPTDDIALSMDGMETGWEQLRKLVNHRGFYQDLSPARLIVPVEQRWLANTLTMSTTDPDNAHQSYNNAKALKLQLLDTPYITDPFFWFLLAEKDTYKVRMGLGEAPDLKSSTVPATRSMMYTSYCSFRAEVHQGMGIWGSRGQ
jgi:hypothetical protein